MLMLSKRRENMMPCAGGRRIDGWYTSDLVRETVREAMVQENGLRWRASRADATLGPYDGACPGRGAVWHDHFLVMFRALRSYSTYTPRRVLLQREREKQRRLLEKTWVAHDMIGVVDAAPAKLRMLNEIMASTAMLLASNSKRIAALESKRAQLRHLADPNPNGPKGETISYDPTEDLPQGALNALMGSAPFIPPSSSDGFDTKTPSAPLPNVDPHNTPVMLEWLEAMERKAHERARRKHAADPDARPTTLSPDFHKKE